MSIVGTRPPLISETNLYEPRHKARLAIKPGITGMWQVSGRSDITDFEEVVRLDKEYIENWDSGFNCMASNKVIESMICDDCVQGVIKKYDFSKMPAKQKLFCQAIYKKSKLLTYMMALLQNWKKKKALFR